jgi:hypothetical protein
MTTKPNLRQVILVAFIFCCLNTSGQICPFYTSGQLTVTNRDMELQSSRFIENVGQVKYQDGRPAADVKYIYSAPGFKLILKENSFSYEVYTLEKIKKDEAGIFPNSALDKVLGEKFSSSVTVHSSRIDVTLQGAGNQPEIVPEGERTDYRNYYNAQTIRNGIKEIRSYEKISYRNIYPGIDFVFYADKGGKTGLKYDIVVHPGGRIENVKMSYAGLAMTRGDKKGMRLDESKLFLSTPEGNITETIPYSFIGETGEPVHAWQVLDGNNVSFRTDAPAGHTLVIDPILKWGTYLGDSADEEGYAITTDKSGNTYISGYTSSSSNIATSGAYQTSYAGGTDAFLAKFNSSGALQWATYFGDFDEDGAYGVDTDTSGNVYISGYTYSTGLSTTGAHQATQAGGTDAFLAKFNSSGTLQWSTYYGGDADEYGFGVATDKSGNVFLGGYTMSDAGIATSGAHKTTNFGDPDAFLVKFNSSGVRQWGTYFGGSDVDAALPGIATDGSGNVFINGITYSTSGVASSGAHQTTLGGDADGFIAKFNTSGTRQWCSYYGGTGEDFYYDLTTDASNNVIGVGYTLSTTRIA